MVNAQRVLQLDFTLPKPQDNQCGKDDIECEGCGAIDQGRDTRAQSTEACKYEWSWMLVHDQVKKCNY